MKKYYILPLSLILFVGCKTPEHSWQVPGTDRLSSVDTSQWITLPFSLYCHVKREYREETVIKLKEKSCVPISEDQVNLWCGNFERPKERHLKPFLVRGVIYGGNPTFTIVKYDNDTGQLVVFHATRNALNMLVSNRLKTPVPHPVVVYLPDPPREIYPTAQFGGNKIYWGRYYDTLDKREIP